jgi:hypothetical protein
LAAVSQEASDDASKILLIGNNGSGKTGSLVSLLKAGYKIRVLDFDNGSEILRNLARAQCPDKLHNLDIEVCSDDYKMVKIGLTEQMRPVTPLRSFSHGMACLTEWPGLGKPSEWGPDTILVVDSMTFAGRGIMNHVANVKGKLTSIDPKDWHPSQPDWGDAMGLQENMCAMLFSKSMKCHCITTAHITYLSPDGEAAQFGFPSALGSKLPPKIGGYFNSILYAGQKGIGSTKTRAIFTKSTNQVNCKTSAPGLVKDDYPLETGLADYFKAIHGPLKA